MPRINVYSKTLLLPLTGILVLVALFTSCSTKGPNLSGNWILEVRDGQDIAFLIMELAHKRDTVTGAFRNSDGVIYDIAYGSCTNSRLTFTLLVEGEGVAYCAFELADNSSMEGQLISLEKKHAGEPLLISAHRAETGNMIVVLKGGWSGSVVDPRSKLKESTYLDLYSMDVLDTSHSCPNPNQMEFSVAGFVSKEPRIDVQPILMGNVSNMIFTFQYYSGEDLVLATLSLDAEDRLVGKYSTPRSGVDKEVVLSKIRP